MRLPKRVDCAKTPKYFQFVFAAITLVLVAGAYLGRMNFLAWVIFVPLWLTFSYCVGAYSLWGGGWAFQ
jgi:ammonium transporter, Amt family